MRRREENGKSKEGLKRRDKEVYVTKSFYMCDTKCNP